MWLLPFSRWGKIMESGVGVRLEPPHSGQMTPTRGFPGRSIRRRQKPLEVA